MSEPRSKSKAESAPAQAAPRALVANHIYAEGDDAPDAVVNESNATGGINLVDETGHLTIHGAEIATQRANTPIEV